jgi:histidinol phosphatase-like PHP family hydrolase
MYAMLYHNIHNHSTYSDGMHTPEELIRYASGKGLDIIGITDHFATKKVRSIETDQLVQYVQHLSRLKIESKGKVLLLMGIEIDASKARTEFDKIDFSSLNSLDYVLFEYVENPMWDGISLDEFFYLRKKLDVPVGLAHPDIELCFPDADPEQLLSELEENKVFLELSTSHENTRQGKTFYRLAREFFQVLKYSDVPIAIGSDTHHDGKDVANIYDATDFVERMELERNIDLFMKILNIKKV